jgi:hypothetical protein
MSCCGSRFAHALIFGPYNGIYELCRDWAASWAVPGKPTPEELVITTTSGVKVYTGNVFHYIASPFAALRPAERAKLFDMLVDLGASPDLDTCVIGARMAFQIPAHSGLEMSRLARGYSRLFTDPNVEVATKFLRWAVERFGGVGDEVGSLSVPDSVFFIGSSLPTLCGAVFRLIRVYRPRETLDRQLAEGVSALLDAGVDSVCKPSTYELAVSFGFEDVARVLTLSGRCDPFHDWWGSGDDEDTPISEAASDGDTFLRHSQSLVLLMDAQPSLF